MGSKNNTTSNTNDLREAYRAQAFWMMFRLILVFGIPAFLAVWIGRQLDASQDTGRTWQLILLAIAFVTSWILVARMYIALNKQAQKVDALLKKNKEKNSSTSIAHPSSNQGEARRANSGDAQTDNSTDSITNNL